MSFEWFIRELKMRGVLRTAITYLVVGWLLLQVISVIGPMIDAPQSLGRITLIVLVCCFPLSLIISWSVRRKDGNEEESDAESTLSNRFSVTNLLPLAVVFLVTLIGTTVLVRNSTLTDSEEDDQRVSDQLMIDVDELKALAAVPFSNISGNSDMEFLGFALVDQVISSLSYLEDIAVRPSSSVRKYSQQIAEPGMIAKELSVRYVLMGHYLTRNDSVRLNLELIDIPENKLLWAGSVVESMSDIFKLQDVVSNKVINGLAVRFPDQTRRRMLKDNPDSPLAYEYYLRAIAAPFSVEGNQISIGLLEKALQIDSTYAPIYAELGNRWHTTANYSMLQTRDAELDRALEALSKCLELNDESLDALGYSIFVLTEINNKPEAMKLVRRMLDINPNSSFGRYSLGYIYRYAGMIEESISLMAQAVQIDPKNIRFRSIGVTYLYAGNYDKAIESFHHEDGSGFSESWRGLTYMRMNQMEKARVELEKAIAQDPNSVLGNWVRGFLSYTKGETWTPEEQSRILETEASLYDPETMYHWGLINLLHKDVQGFLALYEKAVTMGLYAYPFFMTDPLLDTIRDNPEFQRITALAKEKHEEFKRLAFQ